MQTTKGSTEMDSRFILIIGAGPMGIEMAVHAVRSGCEVMMLERGAEIAANVRQWGHVELFSPNSLNMSKWGKEVLNECGRALPGDDVFMKGSTYVCEYLEVLVSWLRKKSTFTLVLNSEVQDIGRGRLLKHDDIRGARRKGTTFRVLVVDTQTGEERVEEGFTHLIDASGTFNQPSWAGMGGIPAIGERGLVKEGRLLQRLPNVSENRERFLNRTTAVIGAGASAITTIRDLMSLAEEGKGTVDIVWVSKEVSQPFKRLPNDPLPQRDALYALGNRLSQEKSEVEGFSVQFMAGCCVTHMRKEASGDITLVMQRQLDATATESGENVEARGIHTVISCCGYKPNDQMWAHLQVHQCYASAAPMKLAAALLASSGGNGDCLAQVSHGPETMLNPEPGMYVVGMKSYGTGSAFLMKMGHQQVADVMGIILSAAMST